MSDACGVSVTSRDLDALAAVVMGEVSGVAREKDWAGNIRVGVVDGYRRWAPRKGLLIAALFMASMAQAETSDCPADRAIYVRSDGERFEVVCYGEIRHTRHDAFSGRPL